MGWNYTIADARVEMLFRLMYATMRHRHYDNTGLGKQCTLAYYELTMYQYLLGERLDSALVQKLRDIVARVNNHSLAMLEEMFDFTLHENIYDVNRVNDQAVRWATQINLFDVNNQIELENWRKSMQATL
jgi:hypothetical protein